MEENKREKALQAISKDPNRIIKTNPIINAKFDITTVQMKVFLKIIATIDQSKDDISEVQISVAELQKFVGRTAKNIHKYLQDELIKLKQRNIFYEDENIRLDTNLLSSIIYYKKQGYFTFEIPKALKPFLLQIKENFTVLDIRNMLFLESIYAMRFYEYCKEFERFKTFEIEVEELKERFGLSERYKNYFDFKLKVINQARSELMKNSELYFDFDEIKEGKKVTRLKFTIIKNKNVTNNSEETEKEQVLDSKILDMIELVKMYVSATTVETWFEKYPEEQIKKGVDYTFEQAKSGTIKDIGAYMQKMVATTNLIDPKDVIKQEQKKKKEQEKEAQLLKQKGFEVENSQNLLKAEYYNAKKELAVKILMSEKSLYQTIFNQLKNENEQERKPFLSEMALNNFRIKNDVSGSLEEFIFNLNEGGSFASYVFDYLQTNYAEQYNQLKISYLPKASSVGVKEEDLL